MRLVSNMLAGALGLVEAEAHQARRGATKAAGVVVFYIAAMALLLGALGLMVTSAFVAIASALGTALAALLTGGGLLLIGLIVLGIGVRMNQ